MLCLCGPREGHLNGNGEGTVVCCRHAGELIRSPKFQNSVGDGRVAPVIYSAANRDFIFRRRGGRRAILIERRKANRKKWADGLRSRWNESHGRLDSIGVERLPRK